MRSFFFLLVNSVVALLVFAKFHCYNFFMFKESLSLGSLKLAVLVGARATHFQ